MNLKVNFFAQIYNREPTRKESCFGINDAFEESDNQGMAYTTTEGSRNDWNAIVENTECKDITFLPLDHNIVLHPKSGEIYSLCDGMLYNSEWIAFVELKNVRIGWIEKSISQIRSTIELFCANHDYKVIKHRVAYAANKRHPFFHVSYKVEMNEFHSRTHFRLLIQNNITVK